jgi:ABC-type phosphate transport system auxiliary subunit
MAFEISDDDFGFSAVSEDELKQLERELQQVAEKNSETAMVAESKLDAIYKAVIPLLNNLMKNPEKEYIYWPDRQVKVKAFMEKLEKIYNS